LPIAIDGIVHEPRSAVDLDQVFRSAALSPAVESAALTSTTGC
jgi:hypothetical protein